VKVSWLHCLMMRIWVVFGEVIGWIGFSWVPEDVVVVLSHSVLYPIEPHVNRLGLLLLDVVIGNACGHGVVCLDGGWWL